MLYGALVASARSEHACLGGGRSCVHASAIPATTHTLAVLGGALLSVYGGKRLGFSGGGALGAIVLGTTAARLWPSAEAQPVRSHVNLLWGHLQPALFGLLGAVSARALDGAPLRGHVLPCPPL